MDRAEIQRLLNQGILAVKNGELSVARDQLMQVVQADSANEPGWLWLAAALADPADQLWALEKVLAINPQNPQALAGIQVLRAKPIVDPIPPPPAVAGLPLGTEPAVVIAGAEGPPGRTQLLEDQPPPRGPMAIAAPSPRHYDTLASEEDPYQCAYCGKTTEPGDNRCPSCGRGLIVSGPWQAGSYLFAGLILVGVQVQAAILQALLVFFQDNYPRALHIIPASLLPPNVLVPSILRAVAWGVIVYLLLSDADFGYAAAAGVGLADIGWAAVGYHLGSLSPLLAGLNAAMAAIISLVALAAVVSQAQARVRLKVVPDRKLDGSHMFHRRALVYARQGKWAMAAVHWRQAITRAPREPIYYKELGRAQARLGRYDPALRSFRSGAEAAPDDPEFPRLIEWVRSLAREG